MVKTKLSQLKVGTGRQKRGFVPENRECQKQNAELGLHD